MKYTPATPREAQKLAKLIAESTNVPVEVWPRVACIVRTEYSGDYYFGVQFWTPRMIQLGSSINTDGTKSIFIDRLSDALAERAANAQTLAAFEVQMQQASGKLFV